MFTEISYLNKYFIFYNFVQIQYRNLYEGNRRDFFFDKERKRAEEARYQKYPNFQAKGLLPERTLESFIKKALQCK